MIIADLAKLPGGTFPARRWGRGLVGQLGQPIAAKGFSMGFSILEPKGGQVPWHNQEQEEVYFIVQGEGEICVGTERSPIKAGQAVFMPPTVFHQYDLCLLPRRRRRALAARAERHVAQGGRRSDPAAAGRCAAAVHEGPRGVDALAVGRIGAVLRRGLERAGEQSFEKRLGGFFGDGRDFDVVETGLF